MIIMINIFLRKISFTPMGRGKFANSVINGKDIKMNIFPDHVTLGFVVICL